MTRRAFDFGQSCFFISVRSCAHSFHHSVVLDFFFCFQICIYFWDWFGLSIAVGTLVNFLILLFSITFLLAWSWTIAGNAHGIVS